jgi:hypothetical protein
MALTKVSTGVVDMSQDTGGLIIAKGTTAQQPTCDASILGSIRENTDENKVEVCTSTGWQFLKEAGGTKPNLDVDYLIVGGGGSGANGRGGKDGGGGGAGGLITSWPGGSGGGSASEATMALQESTQYNVTVGSGGSTVPANTNGAVRNGSSSIFNGFTALGGGGSKSWGSGGQSSGAQNGFASGGGGTFSGDAGTTSPGTGTAASRGYPGNIGSSSRPNSGGGGGSGGYASYNGTNTTLGAYFGGPGINVSITGATVSYAGGGGWSLGSPSGGGGFNAPTWSGGNGVDGQPGTPNTGGGGGGGYTNSGTGGGGGSGVVILRYPDAYSIQKTGLTSSVDSTTVPGFTIETFLSGTGTITFV